MTESEGMIEVRKQAAESQRTLRARAAVALAELRLIMEHPDEIARRELSDELALRLEAIGVRPEQPNSATIDGLEFSIRKDKQDGLKRLCCRRAGSEGPWRSAHTLALLGVAIEEHKTGDYCLVPDKKAP